MDKCPRCGKDMQYGSTMSIFNTEMICIKCKDAETKHPRYPAARKRELAEVKRGNYNFEGIGCPRDLYRQR